MDAAYISTLSALAGTVVGGLSTFATSWMTTTTQARVARLNAERTRRDELYSKFLEEVARLYSDAVTEEKVDFSQLVAIYSLRGRILLQSSPEVAARAEEAIEAVLEIYMSPNRSDREVFADHDSKDPMKPFAAACREELSGMR